MQIETEKDREIRVQECALLVTFAKKKQDKEEKWSII